MEKERLKGTDHEWLGDYLVHTSNAPGGAVISVVVVPARVVAEFETEIPDWDLADASPDNELFKIMSETWPGRKSRKNWCWWTICHVHPVARSARTFFANR